MLRMRRTTPAAVVALVLASCLVVFAALQLSASPPARAVGIGQLQQRISAGQSAISRLSGAVNAATGHLHQLDGSIAALNARIGALQADLNAKRAELIRIQSELDAARIRLAQLEAFQSHAENVLAQQLVNSYEAGQPDLVSVILESHGFQDLLERLSFAQRIQKQDVQIIRDVRAARRAVASQAIRLGALEVRQQTLTAQVLAERNAVAATQEQLLRQRINVASDRAAKAGQLASVRGQVFGLQHQLAQAVAAQAAAAAQAPQPTNSGPVGLAPQISSGGGFTFPLPKGSASGPGSWSEDQGVDISAPGDTPEFAVCSGTIVLHGIGGFGPWAPVLHCDSAVGGYSYVYYGHAGPANQLPVGTHVDAGEVMSSVGPGIVGISTGPHLEIGFADSSGSPIGGGSASTMMSLLQGSY
jgi:murein DD-endopeptidase MepM/ murein hydrolase activator NlpD